MIIRKTALSLSASTGFAALGAVGFLWLAPASQVGAASNCDAQLTARFIESAPRDRFEFSNESGDGWSVTSVTLDLEKSRGQLIFDTESGGIGVEVFQPFRQENASTAVLADASLPADGDDALSLNFASFAQDTQYQFTIDVDDRLTTSDLGQIRVTGGEMSGSVLTVEFEHSDGRVQTTSGAFDNRNQALVKVESCV